jgi:hypothetical protein
MHKNYFFREDNLGDMTVFGEFKHKQKLIYTHYLHSQYTINYNVHNCLFFNFTMDRYVLLALICLFSFRTNGIKMSL